MCVAYFLPCPFHFFMVLHQSLGWLYFCTLFHGTALHSLPVALNGWHSCGIFHKSFYSTLFSSLHPKKRGPNSSFFFWFYSEFAWIKDLPIGKRRVKFALFSMSCFFSVIFVIPLLSSWFFLNWSDWMKWSNSYFWGVYIISAAQQYLNK